MKISPPHIMLFLLAAALLLVSTSADAILLGEAELGYIDYRSESNGATSSASSFMQRYSLLYATNGLFAGGSDGYYKASLGYEWGSMQTTIDLPGSSQDLSVNDGHVLYNGELRYNPRQYPLFLRLFSRDLHRMSFDNNADAYVIGGDPVIHPDLPVNLFGGGSRISNGATLLLGSGWVTGGSGLTESFVDDLPLLSVDYRDTMVRDLKSLTPMNTMQRNLRVTLKKGVNHLHYFLNRDDDYISPSLTSSEQRYVIGNLDSTLNRTWIDLTNWIRVSVDGSYSKSSGPIAVAPVRYDANAYALLTRNTWDASLFSSLERQVYDNHVIFDSRNPVYARGSYGIDTDWQASARYEVKKDVGLSDLLYYRSDARATALLTTFKRSQFTLTPRLLAQRIEENSDKVIVLGLNLESDSTRRYSDKLSLVGYYDLRWENFEGSIDSVAVTQSVGGRAVYAPSGAYKAEFTQQLAWSTGQRRELGQEVSWGLIMDTLGNGLFTDQVTRQTSDFLLSTTSLRGDWNITPRFSVAAQLDEAVQDSDAAGIESASSVRGILRYYGPEVTADANVGYTYVDKKAQGSTNIFASGNFTYTPNPVLFAALRVRYQNVSLNAGPTETNVVIRQELNYSYFPANGMRRKLLDLSESVVHETNLGFTKTSLLVGTKYYPLQRLYLAFDGRYTWREEPEHDSEYAGSGEVGVVYNKFQASLNYSYGRRSGSDNRVDKRLAANVKKQF